MATKVAEVTNRWKVVGCMKSSAILSMFSYIASQMVTIHLKFVMLAMYLAAQTYDPIVLLGQIEGQNLLLKPIANINSLS